MQEMIRNRVRELLAENAGDRVLGWEAGENFDDRTPAVFDKDHLDELKYDSFCAGNLSKYLIAESAKDGFSADELKTLKAGAEQIKEIEGKLTILEQKYPGCGTAPGAGDSVSAEEAGMTASGSNAMKFPSFQGKDLDGNDVDSSKLFAGNSVTVVNFWFTTCNPCVGELADLEALNKDLAAKGGAVVGINVDTLDGNADAISTAFRQRAERIEREYGLVAEVTLTEGIGEAADTILQQHLAGQLLLAQGEGAAVGHAADKVCVANAGELAFRAEGHQNLPVEGLLLPQTALHSAAAKVERKLPGAV